MNKTATVSIALLWTGATPVCARPQALFSENFNRTPDEPPGNNSVVAGDGLDSVLANVEGPLRGSLTLIGSGTNDTQTGVKTPWIARWGIDDVPNTQGRRLLDNIHATPIPEVSMIPSLLRLGAMSLFRCRRGET